MRGYRDDMDMFFRKNRACVTAYMAVINVTVMTLYNKGGGTLAKTLLIRSSDKQENQVCQEREA